MSESESSAPQSFLTGEDASGMVGAMVQDIVEGTLYGIELLLTSSACYLLSRQGLRNSPARCLLIVAMVVMFIGSTLVVAEDIIFNTAQVQMLANPEYDPGPKIFRWSVVMIVVTRISYLLGDIIVVWRAWILFTRQSVFQFILAFCVIVSVGAITCDTVLVIQDTIQGTLSPARVILSIGLLFTNVTATTLIGCKAWYYRHFVKAHLDSVSSKTRVEKILILLVESGFLYCITWIISLLGTKGVIPIGIDTYVALVLPHVEAIYPTIIILLTALQKTYCDSVFQSQGNGEVPSQPLQFATAPASMQQSQVSQISRIHFQGLGGVGNHMTNSSDGNVSQGENEMLQQAGKAGTMKTGDDQIV